MENRKRLIYIIKVKKKKIAGNKNRHQPTKPGEIWRCCPGTSWVGASSSKQGDLHLLGNLLNNGSDACSSKEPKTVPKICSSGCSWSTSEQKPCESFSLLKLMTTVKIISRPPPFSTLTPPKGKPRGRCYLGLCSNKEMSSCNLHLRLSGPPVGPERPSVAGDEDTPRPHLHQKQPRLLGGGRRARAIDTLRPKVNTKSECCLTPLCSGEANGDLMCLYYERSADYHHYRLIYRAYCVFLYSTVKQVAVSWAFGFNL